MTPEPENVSFEEALQASGVPLFVDGFVAGAKWWEFDKTGATMWQSNQRRAESVAFGRVAESDPGDIDPTHTDRFIAGFIEGAKWWEFDENRLAMKADDLERVRREAERRAEKQRDPAPTH